jgi:hypothetical protein
MKVGDKYTKNRKEYTIVRINKTDVATYIMLVTEEGRTFTVGKKTLENEYKRI